MLRFLAGAGLALLVGGVGSAAHAQAAHAPAARAQATPGLPFPNAAVDALHAPGQDLTVSLLTMGTGDRVWEMFGHSSIWIRDRVTGRDTVINWGVFDTTQPNFIGHFLQGLMLYAVGGNRMAEVLYAYNYWNRSVTAQELDLTAAQKDTLTAIIRENFQPENVTYRYDYFVDNCSTRPRDILDRVLGGQLRQGADSLSGTTYRWHTLRLMRSNALLALGVDIGLGAPADKPITRWQEMFLPQKLHDWVATRQIVDSTGARRPLVVNEQILFQASRPLPASNPPGYAWLWIVGLVTGSLFVLLARWPSAVARRVSAGLASLWAVLAGVLGILLAVLWAFTDHRFAHSNANLFVFHPLWLVLAVTLPMTLMSGRAARVTTTLLRVFVALGIVALLCNAFGLIKQDNLGVLGLGVLPAIALLYVVSAKRAESASEPSPSSRNDRTAARTETDPRAVSQSADSRSRA